MSHYKRPLNLIVATDLNGCIGKSGNFALPWKQSEDLKRFKRLTSGNVVIMGYNTFASLGFKPLPNRINIVISKSRAAELRALSNADEFSVVSSLENAISHANDFYLCEKVFLIGGALVYNEAIEKQLVDKMYITVVKTQIDGDAFIKIPDFSSSQFNDWVTSRSEKFPIDEKNEFETIYFVHERR